MNIGGINNVAAPMMTPLVGTQTTIMPIATSGVVPAGMSRMDQLIKMLDGFSSAELMRALLMTQTPDTHKTQPHDDGSMALLNLAQAMQAGALPSAAGFMALPSVTTAVIGALISVQA